MSTNDTTVGGRTIHKGTRYAGAGQKKEEIDDETSLSGREKLFLAEPPYRRTPEEIRARAEARAKKEAKPVDEKKIEWQAVHDNPYMVVNGSYLDCLLHRIVSDSFSPINRLYRNLIDELKASPTGAITRLYLVAIGEEPARREELGTLIRMKIGEKALVLPIAFLYDGERAILKPLPPDVLRRVRRDAQGPHC